MLKSNFLLKMLVVALIPFALSANEITPDMIPDEIVYAIEKNECLYLGGKCYPYTIALNTSEDIAKVKRLGYEVKYSRVIDCKNISQCVDTLERLHSTGLVNTDNGPFQINHQHNPMKESADYFLFSASSQKVRSILTGLIKRDGYSWKTIAKYHSATPSLNEKYRKNLYAKIYNRMPLSSLQ